MDKGVSTVIAAIISAAATIIVGIIGPYGLLQRENSQLQTENASLKEENSVLQEQASDTDADKWREQVNELQKEIDHLRKQLGELSPDEPDDVVLPQLGDNIPSDAVFFGNHAYKEYSEFMTWTNAKLYCESVGGHLVSITDIQESLFISDYISNLASPKFCYWIGLYTNQQRQWAWTTGELCDYQNWAYAEPNNGKGRQEDYVHLYGIARENVYIGEWNNVTDRGAAYSSSFYNLENFGFICEWESIE